MYLVRPGKSRGSIRGKVHIKEKNGYWGVCGATCYSTMGWLTVMEPPQGTRCKTCFGMK